MAFNDISFLFLFFPLAVLAHKLMPVAGKNILLLVLSLLFFAWGSPQYVILLILSILFNYFSGLQMAKQKEEQDEKGVRSLTLICQKTVPAGAIRTDEDEKLAELLLSVLLARVTEE